jgi:hypothetical protein
MRQLRQDILCTTHSKPAREKSQQDYQMSCPRLWTSDSQAPRHVRTPPCCPAPPVLQGTRNRQEITFGMSRSGVQVQLESVFSQGSPDTPPEKNELFKEKYIIFFFHAISQAFFFNLFPLEFFCFSSVFLPHFRMFSGKRYMYGFLDIFS